jgi:hypothetical protein
LRRLSLDGPQGILAKLGAPGPAPPPAPTPTTDYAVDCVTAMIFTDKTPAGSQPKSDQKAVWCHVPASPSSSDLRVLTYFHGWDGHVLVDQSGAAKQPNWWPGGFSQANRASGPKYQLGPAVDGHFTAVKPIAIAPEDGIPDTGSWKDNPKPPPPKIHTGPSHANTTSARFVSGNKADPAALGALFDDTFAQLAALPKPASCGGGNYFASVLSSSDIQHQYLSGHSAGGKPLAAAAASTVSLTRPTDLWLLDCTYGWGLVEYPAWCSAVALGNAADKSRFVGICISGTDTNTGLNSIVTAIKKAGIAIQQIDYTGPGDLPKIEGVLRANPVVTIRITAKAPVHDDIPAFFIPTLLKTAEGGAPPPSGP